VEPAKHPAALGHAAGREEIALPSLFADSIGKSPSRS
jgi:hypothetical protein